MKYIFLFSILAIVGCSNSSQKQSTDTNHPTIQQTSRSLDSVQVVRIVSDFFKAFDDRDLKEIDSLLIPATKIIHYNGVTTNTAEMNIIIKETKDWYPRTRKLSNYEFISDSNLAVVGLTNEVTFSLPENKKVVEKYIETWTFNKIENVWKPIRITYVKVITDKHSEEVK